MACNGCATAYERGHEEGRAQGREDLEWEISDDPLPILLNYLRDQNVDEYEPSTIYYDPAERRIVLEQ